jgi:hypothetical protein
VHVGRSYPHDTHQRTPADRGARSSQARRHRSCARDAPDLRPFAAQAGPEELRELLGAFDFTVTYTQEPRALRLDAILSPHFLRNAEKQQHPSITVGDIFHSGGRI